MIWYFWPISVKHRLSLQSYGRPRMTEELGLNVGHRRVGRLMGENGIKIIRTQKYKTTTDSNHTFNIAPNLLDQNFSADGSIRNGLVTYPISGPVRAGCIWPLCPPIDRHETLERTPLHGRGSFNSLDGGCHGVEETHHTYFE